MEDFSKESLADTYAKLAVHEKYLSDLQKGKVHNFPFFNEEGEITNPALKEVYDSVFVHILEDLEFSIVILKDHDFAEYIRNKKVFDETLARKHLKSSGGNITEASSLLGISRTKLSKIIGLAKIDLFEYFNKQSNNPKKYVRKAKVVRRSWDKP